MRSMMITVKNTFVEMVVEQDHQEDEDSSAGLRRSGSSPSLSATSPNALVGKPAGEKGGDSCSTRLSLLSLGSWATLEDEDDFPLFSRGQIGRGIHPEAAPPVQCGGKPEATASDCAGSEVPAMCISQQQDQAPGGRTPLNSKASLYVPSAPAQKGSFHPRGLHPECEYSHARPLWSSSVWNESFEADVPFTTVMMRNIPYVYERGDVLKLLDSKGFEGEYDFFYLPIDFGRQMNFGYAFVNLTSEESTQRFFEAFGGFAHWKVSSGKVCRVCWSEQQGLHANIQRFQNSSVMSEEVPEEFKPIILSGGKQVPFPKPTRQLRNVRARPSRKNGFEA